MRALEEFLGSFWSLVWAAKNCSSVVAGFARIAFSSARTFAYFSTRRLRFSFFCMAEVFGMEVGSGGGCRLGFGAAEGHAHEAQELAALVVGVGGGEDREVGNAEIVVALAVELGRDAAEVADRRERHGEQPVEELPHRVAPERDV